MELGCGGGSVCWWRLGDWQEAGVEEKLHEWLLEWRGVRYERRAALLRDLLRLDWALVGLGCLAPDARR